MLKLPSVKDHRVPGHCGFHWPQFAYFRESHLQEEITVVLSGSLDEFHNDGDVSYAALKELYRSLDRTDLKGSVEKIIAAGDPYAHREWYLELHGEPCYVVPCCN